MATKKKPPMQLVERAPEAAPERIADSDMAYHRKVIGNRQRATEMARMIEQMHGVELSWIEHLAETYGLNPGDQVDDNGFILRGGGDVPRGR